MTVKQHGKVLFKMYLIGRIILKEEIYEITVSMHKNIICLPNKN